MKILVTGGTGMIGTALVPALLAAGHGVRVLSRRANEEVERFPAEVEPFAADLGEPYELRRAVDGCDVVLHVAGIVVERPPHATFEKINVAGTRELTAVAARLSERPFFVFLSSLGADRGSSEYQQSKLRAEKHVRAYPGPWLILRAGNVYGPGDDTISMLMKLVRSLPAVPLVERGDQPFQPLWVDDVAAALVQAVERRELAGHVLSLAGEETVTTQVVLDRLEELTDLHPLRLPVPAWLAKFGTKALESFSGDGAKLLRRAGLGAPIDTAKLQMLLEGNVLAPEETNALVTEFGIEPTLLDDGLAMLADRLPEQVPGEGFGRVELATYSVEITGSPFSAEQLIDRLCAGIVDVMPIEFAAEPGASRRAEPGATMTAALPGRGHIQVRMEEREPCRATFLTLEGHPLAGMLSFCAERAGTGLRFAIEIVAQSSNALDWVAMRTIGARLQARNWRRVVRRVVKLSGGSAPQGVQVARRHLEPDAAVDLTRRARELVAARSRETLAGDPVRAAPSSPR